MGEENVYLIPAKKVQVEKNPWAEFWQPSRCRRAEKATDEVLFRHPEEFFYTHSCQLSIGLKHKVIF